jgi:hypothetical protein
MDLENFQKFVNVLNLLTKDGNTDRVPHWDYMGKTTFQKSKYYAKLGITDPSKISELESKRTAMMMDNISWGINHAQFVEIDKIEKRLLLMTEAPHNKRILEKVKLPFDSVFLDVNIKEDEIDPKYPVDFEELYGILITKLVMNSVSVPKNAQPEAFARIGGEGHPEGEMYYVSYCGVKQGITFVNDLLIPVDINEEVNIDYHDKSDLNFFRDFVLNLILFITNPEVTLVEFERSKKNAERRIRNNMMPLPSSNRIKLTGKVLRYVNAIASDVVGNGFNFKFWVRGFWREYRSDKYTDMKGKIQWIEPFMKGKGEIRNKIYSVTADKHDVKIYKDEYIFLDDIKPLSKPLREMRT